MESVKPRENLFGYGQNAIFDSALLYYQEGDYESAIEQFKICLSSDPDVSTRERARSYTAGSYGKLARGCVQKKDWEKALHYLDEAVMLRPGFADLRMLQCQIFDHLGRQEDRMFEIRFSLDMNPQYGFAVLHEGIYKYELEDKEEGLARIKESVECDPRLDTAMLQKGIALHEKGDHAGALGAFKQVVPEMAKNPEEVVRTADAHAHEGRWHDAEEGYRKAIELAPHFADVRLKHGRVLFEMGDVGSAISEFREAVSFNPRYTEAFVMLGIAHKKSGNLDEARDAFNAALTTDPENEIAKKELAEIP